MEGEFKARLGSFLFFSIERPGFVSCVIESFFQSAPIRSQIHTARILLSWEDGHLRSKEPVRPSSFNTPPSFSQRPQRQDQLACGTGAGLLPAAPLASCLQRER